MFKLIIDCANAKSEKDLYTIFRNEILGLLSITFNKPYEDNCYDVTNPDAAWEFISELNFEKYPCKIVVSNINSLKSFMNEDKIKTFIELFEDANKDYPDSFIFEIL